MPSLGLIHTSVSSNGIKHTHEKCITLNNTCNCMYMSILNRSNKMTKIMCTYFLWLTHKSRCTWRSEPILFKASFFFPKWPCQCVTSTFFYFTNSSFNRYRCRREFWKNWRAIDGRFQYPPHHRISVQRHHRNHKVPIIKA